MLCFELPRHSEIVCLTRVFAVSLNAIGFQVYLQAKNPTQSKFPAIDIVLFYGTGFYNQIDKDGITVMFPAVLCFNRN